MDSLIELTRQLSGRLQSISFSFDGYVYNPLVYARENHEQYLKLYVKEGVRAMFLGMNPGPYGMLQTGVPFGEINAVRDYLCIDNPVGRPEREHPGRPVLGMETGRSEVSGLRFWKLIAKHFKDARLFADRLCVMNFCPLGFISAQKTAANVTPDKLPGPERAELEEVCEAYLRQVVRLVSPEILIGVGRYAEQRLIKLDTGKKVLRIIHPSPANPAANRGWEEVTDRYLTEAGIWS